MTTICPWLLIPVFIALWSHRPVSDTLPIHLFLFSPSNRDLSGQFLILVVNFCLCCLLWGSTESEVSPCGKPGSLHSANICGLRWRVPFVMTPFPNQKDEGVNEKAYGSFEFTSLLTTIHVDFLSQMSIRKYYQWANGLSRFKWSISPREIYSSFSFGIYVHFVYFFPLFAKIASLE